MSLGSHLHHGRADDPAFEAVTAAHDVAYAGVTTIVLYMHDRFVFFRVERLAERLDPFQSGLLQSPEQLAVDEFDALPEPLDVSAAAAQGQLEGVEDRQQLLDQTGGGPLEVRRLIPQHPLAVVVELRLRPLQV